jgi:hypothetical protein
MHIFDCTVVDRDGKRLRFGVSADNELEVCAAVQRHLVKDFLIEAITKSSETETMCAAFIGGTLKLRS